MNCSITRRHATKVSFAFPKVAVLCEVVPSILRRPRRLQSAQSSTMRFCIAKHTGATRAKNGQTVIIHVGQYSTITIWNSAAHLTLCQGQRQTRHAQETCRVMRPLTGHKQSRIKHTLTFLLPFNFFRMDKQLRLEQTAGHVKYDLTSTSNTPTRRSRSRVSSHLRVHLLIYVTHNVHTIS